MVLSASIMLLVLSVPQPAQGDPKRPEPVVRAWVNAAPLFDDDLDFSDPSTIRLQLRLASDPADQAAAEALAAIRERLIGTELIYQAAMRKLDRINPKITQKLIQEADKQYQRNLHKMRDNFRAANGGLDEEVLRRREQDFADYLTDKDPAIRRHVHRNLIANEYLRSRVMPRRSYPLTEELRAEISKLLEEGRKQLIDDLRRGAMIYVVPDAPR